MRKKALLPMRLQFFADPTPAAGGQQDPGGQATGGTQSGTAPTFDYEKLASIIQGKQTVAEETVLKNYFKQQNLSQDEMNQAIAAFKQQKAAQQPDVNAMQTQLAQSQAAAQQAQIESAATLAAVSLGIDAKSIPYVLKMADLSQVVGQDGKINEDTINNALNKVLEDVPALKPQAAGSAGFVQVGASGQQGASNDEALKKAFGL